MDRQRIDKWLWHARLVRTRRAAAALAGSGSIRVNGARIKAASRKVALGDVLTIAFERVRVLKVLGFCERRGSAETARLLCEDMTPAREAVAKPGVSAPLGRVRGTGRPTKRERRAIDRFMELKDG